MSKISIFELSCMLLDYDLLTARCDRIDRTWISVCNGSEIINKAIELKGSDQKYELGKFAIMKSDYDGLTTYLEGLVSTDNDDLIAANLTIGVGALRSIMGVDLDLNF